MTEVTKSLEDWEKQRGFLTVDRKKYPANKKMTAEEVDVLLHDTPGATMGIMFEERIKFLEDNGYEVNHKNMLDSSLTVVQKDQEDIE